MSQVQSDSCCLVLMLRRLAAHLWKQARLRVALSKVKHDGPRLENSLIIQRVVNCGSTPQTSQHYIWQVQCWNGFSSFTKQQLIKTR